MGRGFLIFLSGIMLAALLVTVHGSVGAQDNIIALEHKDVFKPVQRPPVTFTHEKHADRFPNCTECHHDYAYQSGKKVNNWSGEGQPCSECHKVNESDKKLGLMNAFHQSCTGCHRQLNKDGKKAGPATCGECHIR